MAFGYMEQQDPRVINKQGPNRMVNRPTGPPEWWNSPPEWWKGVPQSAPGQGGAAPSPGAPDWWNTPPAWWNQVVPQSPQGQPPPAMGGPTQGQPPAGPFGVDLANRYAVGNSIRLRDGNFYRMVGLADATKKGKNTYIMKGMDGKMYRVSKLGKKEMKDRDKWPGGKQAAPADAAQAPQPAAPAPGSTALMNPSSSNPVGWQAPGNWWAMDWWNQPGQYKRYF